MISFDNEPEKYFPNDFPLTFTSCFIYFHFPHRVWTDSGRSSIFFLRWVGNEQIRNFSLHLTGSLLWCFVCGATTMTMRRPKVDRKCYYWPIFSFEHYVIAHQRPHRTAAIYKCIFPADSSNHDDGAQKIIFRKEKKIFCDAFQSESLQQPERYQAYEWKSKAF